MTSVSPASHEADSLRDASASDPTAHGWMEGFPPPPDRTIGAADGSAWAFPRTRWAFCHMRELYPTANVPRGDAPVALLPRAERDDLDAVEFTTLDGRRMTWGQSLAANYTDGIVVLHRGVTVQERYFGALQPELAHTAMSVTKSFVGTLAAMLADRRVLDPQAAVTHYLPELGAGAYRSATLRQLMDMTVGVRYSEVYADPQADIWRYARAGGMQPRPAGYDGPQTLCDYLATLAQEGTHGEAFAYKTVNTEVLAWIIKRATGQRLATLTSDLLWSRLGAEHDAHYAVDSVGTESGGGGLNTTLRDLARFGEAMRQDGWFNGQQIIPERVVAGIKGGADRGRFERAGYALLPGWSYRDMWWVTHNAHGAYTARGIHGQAIWIDPKAEMVIARYASHPQAANSPHLDPTSLPAYEALGRHLLRNA
ncbi:MAG: serine hydrolase [Burkholderiaceae bacterium]|nr:serine hydrolase [Burkholderiaceae bacterium]